MKKEYLWTIITGAVLGVIALVLQALGNPENMGLCIACFNRDIAGALGLFNWEAGPRYIRPEIIGIVLGALIAAVAFKEFKPRSGSSPVIRFLLGFLMMVGALVFLGCPTRMIIRMSAGDLNAYVALLGFVAGIFVGVLLLRRGYSIGKPSPRPAWEAWVLPGFLVLLLVALLVHASFTEGGPLLLMPKGHLGGEGSPVGFYLGVFISLAAGLLAGFLGQRSRLCFGGAFRDIFLAKSFHLLAGIAAMFVVMLIGNLILGHVHFSFVDQPTAHTAHVWNFLGMSIVGLCAVLLGGCPFRQLVIAGNGNADAAIVIFGMMAGAAFAHNLSLVSASTTFAKVFVLLAIAVLLLIGLTSKNQPVAE